MLGEPISNVLRTGSENYMHKTLYEFHKDLKKANLFSEISEIVMNIIIFLSLNNKSLDIIEILLV